MNNELKGVLEDNSFNVIVQITESGPKGDTGSPGIDGKSLEFHWNGTQLGVRVEGESEYQYVDLKGPQGERGPQGPPGIDGKSLEFHWDGTKLGVRVEGETEYIYVDLKGEPGDIANLTVGHIVNALGYTPVKSVNNVLADEAGNVELDIDTSAIENRIDDLEDDLDTHKAEIATQDEYGHIRLKDITKESIGLGNVDNVKQMPLSGGVLENYREKLITLSGTSTTIDLSQGNVFIHTLSGNTTYSITNAQSQAHSFTLIINQGATARTVIFPASVKWQGGEIPDLTTANKTYVLTFLTIDGGTNWLGMFGGEF